MTTKSALEFFSTVAVLAVAFTVLMDMRAQNKPSGETSTLELPSEPVSIKGVPRLGSEASQVAIIEYSDFECAFCKRFFSETFPLIKKRFVDSGVVLMAFRHYPNGSGHPDAVRYAESAVCASEQGRFWQMHDALFTAPSGAEDAELEKTALGVGIDPKPFLDCLRTGRLSVIGSDRGSGEDLKIRGTPTFLVGRFRRETQDVKVMRIVPGAMPISSFETAIQRVLR